MSNLSMKQELTQQELQILQSEYEKYINQLSTVVLFRVIWNASILFRESIARYPISCLIDNRNLNSIHFNWFLHIDSIRYMVVNRRFPDTFLYSKIK